MDLIKQIPKQFHFLFIAILLYIFETLFILMMQRHLCLRPRKLIIEWSFNVTIPGEVSLYENTRLVSIIFLCVIG